MSATSDGARILDRGYRPYEGERLGVSAAVRSVARHTAYRALGVHRSARTKVFPVLVVVCAYLPTLIYVGVAVIGNRLERQGVPGRVMAGQFIPTYAGNYGGIVLAILLFAAFVAPEILCPDRRDGMLGIYLASPLDRGTYLLGKTLAVAALLSLVTLGPPLVLLMGYATQGYGPSGLLGWLSTLGRIIAAGVLVSAVFSAISLAISSVTSRKGVAAASVLVVVFGSFAVVSVLIAQGGYPSSLGVFNLFTLPFEGVYRVFAEPSNLLPPSPDGWLGEMSTPLVYGANAAWVTLCAAVVLLRYRRLEVGR